MKKDLKVKSKKNGKSQHNEKFLYKYFNIKKIIKMNRTRPKKQKFTKVHDILFRKKIMLAQNCLQSLFLILKILISNLWLGGHVQ